ncbi:hypothetical protein DASC09_062710 [Saccharomycopsis crataegensis]|uniref:Pre-mRNA-splicing factor 38 n=1 Tax=Saccharomycopsis crataegensis TaxID=43959 RepID=A0AAV5QWV6_9ASCO|nr:hypothetical protein DASC09_062710 [Saccharomycopsis crataegensis]
MNVSNLTPQPQETDSSKNEFKIYQDRGLAKNVKLVHGVNPVLLVEKITREKIQDSIYWKLNCFGINIIGFIEKASSLQLLAGTNISNNPSHFQCLILKLLQIQPSEEVIREFLEQKYFKYLTCVALFYVRLCYDSKEVYEVLEPFYEDFRKIRIRENAYSEVKEYHIDEFVDDMLRKERVCDLILPRLVDRLVLEDNGDLEPRKSIFENSESEESDDEVDEDEL